MNGERRVWVIANWKMNLTEAAAVALVDALESRLGDLPDRIELAVAPSFPALRAVGARLAHRRIGLAAQDLCAEDRGAFTGEVSGEMLAEMGVTQVLVGHSERRQLFGEDDRLIGRKVAAARRHRLAPVLCVGETEAERDSGLTLDVVGRQLDAGLSGWGDGPFEGAVAYEPVWAIGTGRNATPAQVDEVHRSIRAVLRRRFAGAAQRVPILYGGSVTPDNAAGLLVLADVDGALVGGASLDPDRLTAIVRAAP